MPRRWFLLLLGLVAMPSFAQTAPTAPVRVVLETSEGRVVVEVEPAKAPITSANFLRYVDTKRLDGLTFYRVVKLANRVGLVQFGLQGDPKRAFPAIRHEPTTQTGLSHVDGTLSMARGAPGTARSEFTIVAGDQTALDAKPGGDVGYAAFGRVVEGMDVVVRILEGTPAPATAAQGTFKGQTPLKPVKIVSARRVTP